MKILQKVKQNDTKISFKCKWLFPLKIIQRVRDRIHNNSESSIRTSKFCDYTFGHSEKNKHSIMFDHWPELTFDSELMNSYMNRAVLDYIRFNFIVTASVKVPGNKMQFNI